MPNLLTGLVGRKSGRLVVIRDLGRDRYHWVEVRCRCGKTKKVNAQTILRKTCRSCGCLRDESNAAHLPDVTTHGMSRSLEFFSWRNMLSRCYSATNPRYKRYGARGITVCKRWRDSFQNFFYDMGPKPPKTSLGRIDNDGPYRPSNCRWETHSQQNNNHTGNRTLEYGGERWTKAQFSRRYGVHRDTIKYRLWQGWTPQRIIDWYSAKRSPLT